MVSTEPSFAQQGRPYQGGRQQERSFKLVEMLLRRAQGPECKDREGKTALHYASIRGATTLAARLVERLREGEVWIVDNDGRTALDHASENGNFRLVSCLLLRPFHKLSAKDALWLAASNGHKEVVSLLLQHGYDDLEDRVLFEASRNRHYDLASFLHEQGANISFKDTQGMTALHHVAYADHLAVARILVQEGSDIYALDTRKRTPLCLASVCS